MLTNADTLHLADRLRLAIGRLARRLRQQSLGGLTPSQRSVLATLDRAGPMTMGRLAELEGISRPAATGIASRLVERGLVERNPNPVDRRSALVRLTSGGAEVLERGRRERTTILAVGLMGLSEAERQTLEEAVGVLDRLVGEE
ncbi:MAG: MarR family winged helix-turn-helix transcriptional regulator [Actinomycetota bacterium]